MISLTACPDKIIIPAMYSHGCTSHPPVRPLPQIPPLRQPTALPDQQRTRRAAIPITVLTLLSLLALRGVVRGQQPGDAPGVLTAASQRPAVQAEGPAVGAGARPRNVEDLLKLSPSQLARVDIALMNLLCAQGLPGAEDLDIPGVLATLDDWAARVQRETDRNYYRFLRDPAEYNHSEAEFRMLCLITVLQLDLGVHYNMARAHKPDFKNSKDLFIHGMLGSDNGGTCASMPVLYIAVGRRLGYPLKLVLAREHPFVRWEDGHERLNIEGASRGMHTYPDEHYRTWPKPIKDEWVESGEFLRSLTAREELADFLALRGHCLNDNGRLDEARKCYQAAARLNPKSQAYPCFVGVNEAMRKHRKAGGRVPLELPPDPYAP